MATRLTPGIGTTGFGTDDLLQTPTAVRRQTPVASLAGAPATAATPRVPPTATPTEPGAIVNPLPMATSPTPQATARAGTQPPPMAPPAPAIDPNRGTAILGYYDQYLGRDPRQGDLDSYNGYVNGTMTLADIERAIATSPEAWERLQRQASGGGDTGGGTGDGTNWATLPYSGNANNIRSYFAAQGLTGPVLDRVTQTWLTYSTEPWAVNDPTYLFERMQDEEELRVLRGQPRQAGAPTGATPASGVGGTGTPGGTSALDSVLARFLSEGGLTDYGREMRDLLNGMIATGGLESPATQQRLRGARDDAANAFTGQLADVRNATAARGQQGGLADDAIARLGESIAPEYARAVSDIETAGMDRANDNIMGAFQMATGLADSEARNLLQAIGVGSTREVAFAQIALQQLSENRQWNQFLAQFGLDREQLAWEIENGNTQNMIRILDLWLRGADTAAQGQAAEPEN